MSGYAETIHATLARLSVGYPGPEDANKAHAALDALVAELVRQADRIAWLEGDVAGWRIKLAEAHSALRIIAEHSTDDGSRQLAEAVLEQTSLLTQPR